MNYKIIWKTKALKQAKELPADVRAKVSKAVGQLENRKNWNQVKQLTNHQYDYRLRVGRYRVLFNCGEEIKVVRIEEVKKRDERTY
jgi:mRNA-degrading endonuclease RelE of RelBE toxin-antitoxin system